MAGKYYVIVEGGRRGPFGKEELEGQGLRRDSLVWFKGLPDWVAAGRVPELLDVFDEPPPVPGEAAPGEAPPLAALPSDLTIPERAALPSEQIKDPAVNVPRNEAAPPTYADERDSLAPIAPRIGPWRIPYDAIGMRRLYVGGMATYVPGLILVLVVAVVIAWLSMGGIQTSTPRFDPQRRDVVNEFDPAARTMETLTAVASVAGAVLGVTGLVIGAACFFVLLYRAWRVIDDGRSSPTPAKAVGFLFIPFFNVYWVYVALWGLARRLNRFGRRHELDVPIASQPLGLAMSVYCCLTYLPIPFAGLVPLGLNLILWPFFMRSVYRNTTTLCEDANRERIAQAGLERSLRQLDLPRPVSAHITSIAAMVLALIGTPVFVIAFIVGLHTLQHYNRDILMSDAQRQGVEHLRGLNPPDPNRLRDLQNRLNNTEGMLFRWRHDLIVSTAVMGLGVFLLAIAITLAHVSRLCARVSEDAVPQVPPAWPATHGAGFLPKNARRPWRHSSVSRGAALPWAASSIDSDWCENRPRYSLVRANACGPPSAHAPASASARSSNRSAGATSLTNPVRTASLPSMTSPVRSK
jgi:hypothetical protein